jgi:1,4-alpha-glucan branching enzyme
MGGEFGQVREWNHDAQLDWFLLDEPLHRGLHRMVSDLNHVYVREPALSEADCSPAGFEWIDHTAAEDGVLSFIRYTADRDQHVVVVSNFTPVVRHAYPVGVPEGGAYHELFNSDAELYGGSNVGNAGRVMASDEPAHGRPHSLSLVLPPLATMYFKPVR